MNIRNVFCVAVTACLLAGAGAHGQAQTNVASNAGAGDQPAATLKMDAREVLLPVTVRDKKGALVTTLNVSDFTLTEDGRPQKIKSFTRESNLPYRLGLLVDTSRSLSDALESERKAADKFVDTMLPEDPKNGKDQAFLLHFDHEVELLEDFTSSRSALHHELEGWGRRRGRRTIARGRRQAGTTGRTTGQEAGAARSCTTPFFWRRTS